MTGLGLGCVAGDGAFVDGTLERELESLDWRSRWESVRRYTGDKGSM